MHFKTKKEMVFYKNNKNISNKKIFSSYGPYNFVKIFDINRKIKKKKS